MIDPGMFIGAVQFTCSGVEFHIATQDPAILSKVVGYFAGLVDAIQLIDALTYTPKEFSDVVYKAVELCSGTPA